MGGEVGVELQLRLFLGEFPLLGAERGQPLFRRGDLPVRLQELAANGAQFALAGDLRRFPREASHLQVAVSFQQLSLQCDEADPRTGQRQQLRGHFEAADHPGVGQQVGRQPGE